MGASETDVDAGKIDPATAAAARRTVARLAARQDGTLAEQAAMASELFDMLGIRGPVPEVTAEPEPEPCEPMNRPKAEQHVSVEHLQMVVERIRMATGWSREEIARRAEISGSTLASACAPSSTRQFVRQSMYSAVVRLAEELSA